MNLNEHLAEPRSGPSGADVVGETIAALVVGADERGVANQAILLLQTTGAIVAAQTVSAATTERLGRALDRIQLLELDPALGEVRVTALDLAQVVHAGWCLEDELLELMAQGRLAEAEQLGRRVNENGPLTDMHGRRLSMALHQLAGSDEEILRSLRLPRAVTARFGLPDFDPAHQVDAFDATAWLAEVLAPLRHLDRIERAMVLRSEAERWQVNHVELVGYPDSPPKGMTRAEWLAAVDATEQRVAAIRDALIEGEGWPSLSSVPARLDGAGNAFTLKADGTGDFATFEQAMAAIPSGARLAIAPGHYRLGGLISRTLDIFGDGPAGSVVFEGEFQSVFPVMAIGGSLRNLSIRNTGGADRYGLWITSGELLVEECEISSQGDAAVFVSGNGASPRFQGCRLSGPSAYGLLLRDATARLESCMVSGGARAGAAVEHGGSLELVACTVERNSGVGIEVDSTSVAQVWNCRIEGNGRSGVAARPAASVRITDSTITGNGTPQIHASAQAKVFLDGEPFLG